MDGLDDTPPWEGNDPVGWIDQAAESARRNEAFLRWKNGDGGEQGFRSKFGAVTWADLWLDLPSYGWLVKGVIPYREVVLIYGAPQTGKSFETQHLSLHVALGRDYYGRRVKRAGVVYCAFEGGKGFRKRQLAMAKAMNLGEADAVDMVVLTRRADLFSNDVDLDDLIAEIKHWGATFAHPVGLVVLDTWSACTPGANENASEDVSRIRARIMRIAAALECSVIVVHHKPASGGRPRGHGSLTGDFETTIDVDWATKQDGRDEVQILDGDGRKVRAVTVTKQREGEQGMGWRFVLRQQTLGLDEDGDPITSCSVHLPAGDEDDAGAAREPEEGKGRMSEDGRWYLRPNLHTAFQGLANAIERLGRQPPEAVRAPAGAHAVTLTEWRDEWMRLVDTGEEDAGKLEARVKAARDRAREKLVPSGFIVVDSAWVWRTDKRVFGIDKPVKRDPEPGPVSDVRDMLADMLTGGDGL